jgi:hypothetical protein
MGRRFSQPARKFGKLRYHLYTTYDKKRDAEREAKRLRDTGTWLVRIVHSSLGYDLYTRQKKWR